MFPELALTGYPPEDLLLKRSFLRRAQSALEGLAIDGITAMVGWPEAADGHVYNAAAVVARRRACRPSTASSSCRTTGSSTSGAGSSPATRRWWWTWRGTPVGITVCEDIWAPEPTEATAAAGAQVVVNLSASPYHHGKGMERERMIADLARDNGVTMAFCNLVGGQDELVFDGHSLIVQPDGEVTARGPQFDEALVLPGQVAEPLPAEEEVYRALVTGVRDYVDEERLREGGDRVLGRDRLGPDGAGGDRRARAGAGGHRDDAVALLLGGHALGRPDALREPRTSAARAADRGRPRPPTTSCSPRPSPAASPT